MDVDRVFMHTEAKDADPAKKLAYLRQVGAAGSAFEHAVPERLFADPAKPLDDPTQPQGISAVKALAIAAGQGQRIYTLNQQNQAYHAGIVAGLGTDADTKAEIANALNAGMEVTVHQADITAHGWTGSGYIVLDPETGAGAYKISGGANGAVLIFLSILLSALSLLLTILIPSAQAGDKDANSDPWIDMYSVLGETIKQTVQMALEEASKWLSQALGWLDSAMDIFEVSMACNQKEVAYLMVSSLIFIEGIVAPLLAYIAGPYGLMVAIAMGLLGGVLVNSYIKACNNYAEFFLHLLFGKRSNANA
jgi:hypothetical protein